MGFEAQTHESLAFQTARNIEQFSIQITADLEAWKAQAMSTASGSSSSVLSSYAEPLNSEQVAGLKSTLNSEVQFLKSTLTKVGVLMGRNDNDPRNANLLKSIRLEDASSLFDELLRITWQVCGSVRKIMTRKNCGASLSALMKTRLSELLSSITAGILATMDITVDGASFTNKVAASWEQCDRMIAIKICNRSAIGKRLLNIVNVLKDTCRELNEMQEMLGEREHGGGDPGAGGHDSENDDYVHGSDHGSEVHTSTESTASTVPSASGGHHEQHLTGPEQRFLERTKDMQSMIHTGTSIIQTLTRMLIEDTSGEINANTQLLETWELLADGSHELQYALEDLAVTLLEQAETVQDPDGNQVINDEDDKTELEAVTDANRKFEQEFLVHWNDLVEMNNIARTNGISLDPLIRRFQESYIKAEAACRCIDE